MEAFEHVVRVFLEAKGYAVTTDAKFLVTRRTRKKAVQEYQKHGYEVDIVAAKHGELLLGEVKSYFGSKGVNRQGFSGLAGSGRQHIGRYKLFNDRRLRSSILRQASTQYGYPTGQIHLALFVGRFLRRDEDEIRNHLRRMRVTVYDIETIVDTLVTEAEKKTYRNDPVIVTLKALKAAGRLAPTPSAVGNRKGRRTD